MKKTFMTTRDMVQTALFAAILCVLSPWSIPIGPVPITLSVFAVLLCGIMLKPKNAILAVVVYILIGAVGIPVFSGGKAGFSVLIGLTGGYIWSYVFMIIPIALLKKVKSNNKVVSLAVSFCACLIAIVICYAFGTAQFVLLKNGTLLTGEGWISALGICVIPFIPFDIAKAVCATVLGGTLRYRLKDLLK